MSKTGFFKSLISVDPTKIAIFIGLRTAIAVGVPLIIGVVTGHILNGISIAVGALLVSLTDVGGAYKTKAVAMVTATIGVAASAFVGTLVGGHIWLTIPLMFLWGVCAGFAGVYGSNGTPIGLVISIAFLSAINLPNNLAVAVEMFLQNLAGGVWATALSLFLWFLKPYQPIQDVISNCYSSLTKLITAFDEIIKQGSVLSDQSEHIIVLEQEAKNTLEIARSQLIAVRLTQHAANITGEHLLVLFEIANQMLDTTIVLTQLLESGNQSQIASIRTLIKDTFNQMSVVTGALVVAVKNGNAAAVETESINNIITALEQQKERLRVMFAEAHVSNIAQIAEKFIEQLLAAVDTVKCLCVGYWKIDDSKIAPLLNGNVIQRDAMLRVSTFFEPLRANFTFESVILRHALRVGVTTAFSIIVYTLFHLQHGFWITLTIVVILKPDFGSTLQRALHRMGGTIVGAALASVLAITIHNNFLLLIFIILMTFAAISLITVNYGFATVFITPLVVLLLNLVNPDVGWQIAGIRILNTIIGGGLALVGGYLLFPSWERLRFPRQLARAVMANQVYNQQILAGYLKRENIQEIWEARRQAELENTNTAASFQKLLSEPSRCYGSIDSSMILINSLERLFEINTALFTKVHDFDKHLQLPDLEKFALSIKEILLDLADAIENKHVPQPLPPLDRTLDNIHINLEQIVEQPNIHTHHAILDYTFISILLDRIVDQVTVMHSKISATNSNC
ncbi:hypothetical protein NIES2101_13555 [Calothrix sp. HK-06]|nr:hypothetical protein NIES2101_13555 [Calothrix sp. HK-06]